MNLETIGKLATKVKTKRSSAKVIAVVNLDSETSSDANAQHGVVLLGADVNVKIHDPLAHYKGAPNRQLPKEEFCKRWAKT